MEIYVQTMHRNNICTDCACMEIYEQTMHGNICTDNEWKYMYIPCMEIYVQTMHGNL